VCFLKNIIEIETSYAWLCDPHRASLTNQSLRHGTRCFFSGLIIVGGYSDCPDLAR